MPTLHDGREVASNSPEWQLECLALHVLRLPTRDERRAWLEKFAERNRAMSEQLRERMLAIHQAGKRPVQPASE